MRQYLKLIMVRLYVLPMPMQRYICLHILYFDCGVRGFACRALTSATTVVFPLFKNCKDGDVLSTLKFLEINQCHST